MKKICKWLKATALAEQGFDFKKHSLAEVSLVESFAEKHGISEQLEALDFMGQNFDDVEVMRSTKFGEVMTTAHFTNYFSNALSRLFYKDYMYKSGAWRQYTYADTAPDFRDVDRLRMTEPGTLIRRREKGELKATHIEESLLNWGVEEFGRQFDVSWQTIMNDDLGKIRQTPQRMARAARRFEDQFVSNLYDNAVTQATLAALGAPWAGTGRLTAANLAIGINAMMVRNDVNGNQMNIDRIHLVIPPVLRIQARVILESVLQAGVATNDKNVLNDFIAGVHVDPYITTAGINIPWYLFADPSEIPTVTVGRLQNFDQPWVFMKRSNIEMMMGRAPAPFLMSNFETGDIEYAVEDIIGGWDDPAYVGVTDFRGIYYSSGTTP
jgi:hypothetical protein